MATTYVAERYTIRKDYMSNYNYCLATHPDKPNTSANSRGRKYHITLDKTLSLCNLPVTSLIASKDEVFDSSGMPRGGEAHWSPTQYRQGMCGNCRQTALRLHIDVKDMEY